MIPNLKEWKPVRKKERKKERKKWCDDICIHISLLLFYSFFPYFLFFFWLDRVGGEGSCEMNLQTQLIGKKEKKKKKEEEEKKRSVTMTTNRNVGKNDGNHNARIDSYSREYRMSPPNDIAMHDF